jgi:uncharacterized repeat protein (TIGR01451 family)
VTITAQSLTNAGSSLAQVTVQGAVDPNTAIELLMPGGVASNLQVLTNGVVADGSVYRVIGQTVRVKVGTAVHDVRVGYVLAPSTAADYYAVSENQTLTVASPGLLANDSPGVSGGSLAASLAVAPQHGMVSLNPNGSFVYTPTNGFSGSDLFSYTASNGQTVSAPTTVIIAVKPTGAFFADDFTRATDPGPLAPWSVQSGAWTVTGGILEGGPDAFQTYGYAYSQNWTNYSVQGRIRFPAGAYGGALGGRLDSTTGAHYAAWVYPEGSSGGSSLLKLVKFQTWTSFGYNGSAYAPMAQVNLPGVGTNWHNLKIAFFGRQIAVFYDGANVLTTADNEFNAYSSGGITADMWTDLSTYSMSLDDVAVYPEVADDSYLVTENSALTVVAPGVLANDTAVFGPTLSASLLTAPTNGSVILQNDGSFVYTPGSTFNGGDSFVYQAIDSGNLLGTATVNLSRAGDRGRGTGPMIQFLSSSLGAPGTVECAPALGTSTNLFVTVADQDGGALQVVWNVNGTAAATNQIAASAGPATNVSYFSASLPLGLNQVSVSVSDGFFAPVILSNIVTVVDTQAPVPTLASLPVITGSCSVAVTSVPTAGDACAGLIVATTSDPVAFATQGTNLIHWVYRDGHGNSSMQIQTVIVKDTTPPVITKGAIAASYSSVALAQAAALAATTASDNCSSVTKSVSTAGTCAAAVTVVATDASGNSSSVVYGTKILNGDPIFSALPAATAGYQCYGDVPPRPPVTATDSCGNAVSVSFNQTESAPGSSSNNVMRRIWTATGATGTSVSFTQTITIRDITAPMIACPANVTNGDSVVVCSFTPARWSTTNSGANAGTILSGYFSTVYPAGFVEIGIPGSAGFSAKFTGVAAARAYLASVGTPGVFTADLVNPIAASAGGFGAQVLALQFNVDFGDAGAAAGIVGSLGNMIFSDNTSALNGRSVRQILGMANIMLGGGAISGLSIAEANTLLVNLNRAFDGCQASDWALGHLLPPNGTVTSTGAPVVTDNCDKNPNLSYSDVIAAGVCPGAYTIIRTWTASDASGNSNACVQIISLGTSSASVCGRIAFDCNGNRSLVGDDGMAGIPVVLKSSIGTIIRSTATDGLGKYCFSGLGAGTYRILVAPPANYQPSVDPDGIADNSTLITLGSCDAKNGMDFGYYGTAPSLSIVQTGPAACVPGSTITFNFAVTNTGNSCLTGIQVTDTLLGGSIYTQLSLAPKQGFAFSKTYVVKASDPSTLSSLAVVSATPALAASISSSAMASVGIVSAPLALSATAGNAKVTLTWNPVAGAAGYAVKRALAAAGPFSSVASGITAANYSDLSPTNNVLYYYVVTDTQAGVESAPSAPVACMASTALPSPWNSKDVGSLATPGGTGNGTNKFILAGSGADIWGTSDAFRYLYQLGSGDCSVVARVVSVQSTDPWAKAGVMIRESLAANSSHASTFLTPSNGTAFQFRSGTGAASGNVNSTVVSAPYWVKIVRTGNVFASYSSATGSTWAFIGSQTIPMASTVYIGLAVTSHNDGILCTAVFDNISAVP